MSLQPMALRSTLALALLVALPAVAQQHDHHAAAPEKEVDHSTMDHSKMDHSTMDHSTMDHSTMDHSTMDHSQRAPAQLPHTPIPIITDADRSAAFPVLDHASMQHAPPVNSLLLVNRLEHGDGNHGTGQSWEASGWIGGDLNRLWLRSEGERSAGRTDASDLEVLYGRSISPWWDLLAGVKQDFRPADSRSWAAFGIQGLAPYKFETSATLYLGSGGQVMASAEVEYDVLLSNRLILQPLLEATVAARDEPRQGIGKGLNKVEAGLRLRYEISRRFAPYVGITHERLFGDTADHARAAEGHARDTRWVAGIRMWF